MTSVLFTGCSFVEGIGLPGLKDDENLFCNQLTRLVNRFNDSNVVNLAQGGLSNLEIFKKTAQELLKNHHDYVFVCWTSDPRFNLYTDRLREDFFISITPHMEHSDPMINKLGTWLLAMPTKKSMKKDLVLWSEILNRLVVGTNTQIFYVDCLAMLDANFKRIATNINSLQWLNLDTPFWSTVSDSGTDNIHPGPESHRNFAKILAKQLEIRYDIT